MEIQAAPVRMSIAQIIEIFTNDLTNQQIRTLCYGELYLTDGPDEQIVFVSESGVLPFFSWVLSCFHEQDAMVATALHVLGNITTVGDDLTQVSIEIILFSRVVFQNVIDLGALQALMMLSDRIRTPTVVKEGCWLVSNVLAGTTSQIQAVIDAGIMPLIVEVLRTVSPYHVIIVKKFRAISTANS